MTDKPRTSKGSGRKKTTVAEKLSKIPFDLEKVEKIAAYFGSTDAQLASVLGLTEDTITKWKKDKSFLIALKRGKNEADSQVVKSLYQRATGYSHDAVKIFMPANAKEPIYAPYVEHYPPDSTAMIFWLKNRQREDWRDSQDFTSDGEKISAIEVTIVRRK